MTPPPSMPFSELLGIRVTTSTPDLVEAEMEVRPDLCTIPAVLHGGAMMALADSVGALATVLNLPDGAWTTTIESKTNFLAALPVGEVARAACTPIHKGRQTMVWQTKISRADGRLAGVVTQTQLVIPAKT
jgi:1,4-dihydroxy-2-naphthoyl-CoA hydrolase